MKWNLGLYVGIHPTLLGGAGSLREWLKHGYSWATAFDALGPFSAAQKRKTGKVKDI